MVRCPKCGTKNPDHAKGCVKCGENLTNIQKNDKSSNNKIIAVIAIVVIIAIVGVVASGMLSTNTTDNVVVKDNSEVVTPVADNQTDNNTSDSNSDESESGEYWASSKTDKFHLPTCEWAEKISGNNKIVYHSRDDAIEDGKIPCSVCNP